MKTADEASRIYIRFQRFLGQPIEMRCAPMFDIILIAVGCGLFAAAIAYAYACDHL